MIYMANSPWLTDRQVRELLSGRDFIIYCQSSDRIIVPAQDTVMHTGSLWGGHPDLAPDELERTIIQALVDNPELLQMLGMMDLFYNPRSKSQGNGRLKYFMLAAPETDGVIIPETTVTPTTELINRAGLSKELKGPYAVLFLPPHMARANSISIAENTYHNQRLRIDR